MSNLFPKYGFGIVVTQSQSTIETPKSNGIRNQLVPTNGNATLWKWHFLTFGIAGTELPQSHKGNQLAFLIFDVSFLEKQFESVEFEISAW